MRTIRSLPMALALLMMLAVPVMAQNGSEGDTVTKTFELTLNGDVPADHLFTVHLTPVRDCGPVCAPEQVKFCGKTERGEAMRVLSDEDCVGDGKAYTYSAELPEGMVLRARWIRIDLSTGTSEVFRATEETIDADMTNTAVYTFGTGVGDDKQDDTKDDQQGEMPREMPDTGAGGLAPGATIQGGNAAVGLTLLVGAGYAVLRRRSPHPVRGIRRD